MMEYSDVFSRKLGCVENFTHNVKLKRTAQRVQQKLRKLPLAARDKMKVDLDKLLADDVIEPVEASE